MSIPSELAHGQSRRRMVVGIVASCLLAAVLWGVAALPVLHVVGLTLFMGLLPALAVAQVPLAREMKLPRLQVYASSAATLTGLAVVSLTLSVLAGGPDLGFRRLSPAALTTWTLGLVLAGLVMTLAFKVLSSPLGLEEGPILRALLPRTASERRAFGGLSVAAGLGEEMAYRGYVLGLLVPLLGTGGAVVVSSAVFGVLHAYQGVLGLARTATAGALMAGGFILSGSLWPPVLAHILFDVLVGLVLADYLVPPASDEDGLATERDTDADSGVAPDSPAEERL